MRMQYMANIAYLVSTNSWEWNIWFMHEWCWIYVDTTYVVRIFVSNLWESDICCMHIWSQIYEQIICFWMCMLEGNCTYFHYRPIDVHTPWLSSIYASMTLDKWFTTLYDMKDIDEITHTECSCHTYIIWVLGRCIIGFAYTRRLLLHA